MGSLISELHEKILTTLTAEEFLNRLRVDEDTIIAYVLSEKFANGLRVIEAREHLLCKDVLGLSLGLMDYISPREAQDWLYYISQYILAKSFEEATLVSLDPKYEASVMIFLTILRILIDSKKARGFNKFEDFSFLDQEEIEALPRKAEYIRFLKAFKDNYIYELMMINQELYDQNTLNHVAAVHYVAMHVARQMKKSGFSIDLGLVSGAAAGHDIGKYGCKESEQGRIAYLHYYYTDQWFAKFNLPSIGLIATNHSTWDLELENLPLESLVLIYADFRVKNRKIKDSYQMYIYNLKESFDVILSKLDNVDEAKEKRYRRVYAKLKDFEDYMVHEGIDISLKADELNPEKTADYVLMDGENIIKSFKYMAIKHNTSLLNKLNNETVFSSMIESARSEQNWEKLRAYLNVLDEYSIYLSQREKIYTLYFLYDMLMHKKEDIRRQASRIMGNVIVSYNLEYTKELPKEHALRNESVLNSLSLWNRYLGLFIDAGHKVTEKHREWLGYAMRIFVDSVVKSDKNLDKNRYVDVFLNKMAHMDQDDISKFSILNSLLSLPPYLYRPDQLDFVIGYAKEALDSPRDNISLMAWQLLYFLSKDQATFPRLIPQIKDNINNLEEGGGICINYVKSKIARNIGAEDRIIEAYHSFLDKKREDNSDLFLKNLKTATPWNVKTVSVEYIMDYIHKKDQLSLLQTATHLTNLVKVSEKETVRKKAGDSLVSAIGPLLTVDQRNEITVELFKGLEIDELQFAKYIPKYLGRFILLLPSREMDECILELETIYKGSNPRSSTLVIDTLGVMVQYYPSYTHSKGEEREAYANRYKKLLGMLLSGLANYNSQVKQEAFLVIGQVFDSKILTLEDKYEIFALTHKKLLALINEEEPSDIFFFNNSASFNHIYRFISDYQAKYGDFDLGVNKKIAFFPGTFDPFSLGHKGIATAIRDLGYEVYLSLDEFSWSKRMQPRMIRRQIINMSIADELDIFLFPDNMPVNLSSSKDLSGLRQSYKGKDVNIVIGSDVLANASAYKKEPIKDSIHSFNHLVFSRSAEPSDKAEENIEDNKARISGSVLELKLPVFLEDISSTQIRENVDSNRDISNLIDPLAQSFIYAKNLYTREPLDKGVLNAKPFVIEVHDYVSEGLASEIDDFISLCTSLRQKVSALLLAKDSRLLTIRDRGSYNKIIALATFHPISTSDAYDEFGSQDIANYLRDVTAGKIMVIDGIFVDRGSSHTNLEQIVLTETLANILKNDYTYALYYARLETCSKNLSKILKLQGFGEIKDKDQARLIYGVDMKFTTSLTLNMLSSIKEPLCRSKKVIKAVERAREDLQEALTGLYPNSLLLSIDNEMINQKLIDKICSLNNVSNQIQTNKETGEKMCVPFGDILRGMVVPNTVTKSLHTEKFYSTDAKTFRIAEYPFYSPIENQVKTIKSFERPVILVDDLMHKGYRIKELDPILKRYRVNVDKIIVGIMSGRGRDLMQIQERKHDCAYFIPNLRLWFNENLMYPFLGGDAMGQFGDKTLNLIPSTNLILPFYSPMFISNTSREAIYSLSLTSLKNAKMILKAIEEEYQEMYGRKLTVKRLGEVLISPRLPYLGESIHYDLNKGASYYMDIIIENLEKLERMLNYDLLQK